MTTKRFLKKKNLSDDLNGCFDGLINMMFFKKLKEQRKIKKIFL